MKAALMGALSPAGYSLMLGQHLEACEWEKCQQIEYKLGLTESALAGKYVEALRWASAMIGELGGR